jgi:hypothetical protein
MTDARAQILARLPRIPLPAAYAAPAPAPGTVAPVDTLVPAFMQAITANGLTSERTSGVGASRLAVLAGLRRAAVAQVYAARAIDQAVPGLLDAMAMLELDTIVLETDGQRIDDTLAQPKSVGGGLLVAAAAWADTGTVLLRFPTRRSALAYVWPPRTWILLPVAHLFASQHAWLDHQRQTGELIDTLQADFSLVSGLTSTRDVASTAVTGVYGASEIHILIIEPETAL